MFRWIIGSSLQFRFLVVGIAVALVAFGWTGLQKMPVDVFPEFAAPIVEVQTEAIGLPAKEVESLITLNLEELLSGRAMAQVDPLPLGDRAVVDRAHLRARHRHHASARQMVQERLTLAYTLPNVRRRRSSCSRFRPPAAS